MSSRYSPLDCSISRKKQVSKRNVQRRKKAKPTFSKYGYSSNLNRWKVFNYIKPEFVSQIHMIMALTDDAALIVTKDKMIYGLGNNNGGRLGIGKEDAAFQPKKVEALCGKSIKTFCAINSCFTSVFALTEEGEIYSWAHNEDYMLGLGSAFSDCTFEEICFTPNKVAISEECIDIACSFDHVIVLTNNGKVYTWGTPSYANIFQCCEGLPSQVKYELEGKKVIYITCGYLFNIVITNNSKIYSWGMNNFGQLGIGNCIQQAHPCLIASLVDIKIVKVVAGQAHALALTAEGELYFWGKNTVGQLGHGIKTEKEINPIKLNIPEMGKVLDIATQYYLDVNVAMNENKHVYVWGECFIIDIVTPVVTHFTNIYNIFVYNMPYIIQDLSPQYKKNQSNILECLQTAFNDSSTSDLTIQVEGQSFYVHKTILKIRCQYFRNMFEHNSMENDQNIIVHNQFSYIVYEAFLKYLYTGTFSLPLEKVLELMELADVYCETDLMKDCVEMIKKGITVSNVAFVYKKALKYSKELEEFCFQFALEHLTDVVQTESFASLKKKIKFDFIIKAAKAGGFKK